MIFPLLVALGLTLPGDKPKLQATVEIQKARQTVSLFLESLADPHPAQRGFAVQMLLRDGERAEWVWLHRLKFDGKRLSGVIKTPPKTVGTAKVGDAKSLSPTEIGDWMFYEGDKIVGGFAARAALSLVPKKDRAKLTAKFAPYTHRKKVSFPKQDGTLRIPRNWIVTVEDKGNVIRFRPNKGKAIEFRATFTYRKSEKLPKDSGHRFVKMMAKRKQLPVAELHGRTFSAETVKSTKEGKKTRVRFYPTGYKQSFMIFSVTVVEEKLDDPLVVAALKRVPLILVSLEETPPKAKPSPNPSAGATKPRCPLMPRAP